jgi:hypothetical protein
MSAVVFEVKYFKYTLFRSCPALGYKTPTATNCSGTASDRLWTAQYGYRAHYPALPANPRVGSATDPTRQDDPTFPLANPLPNAYDVSVR